MFDHAGPGQALSINSNGLMMVDCEAHSGKGRLGHQAGMGRKIGLASRPGAVEQSLEQGAEQALALGFGPDIGKVDIAARFERHEAETCADVFGQKDIFPAEPRVPVRPVARRWGPGARLCGRVLCRARVNGVIDQRTQRIIVFWSSNPKKTRI